MSSEFRTERSMMEATSLHRPNERWTHTDRHGHIHQWWTNGAPATSYRPTDHFIVPTLHWVQTGVEYTEDGDEIPIGEHRCVRCEEKVEPGYKPDDCTQYVPGLTRYLINGRSVSKEEYLRRYLEEHPR
jgi:hypothetical protein